MDRTLACGAGNRGSIPRECTDQRHLYKGVFELDNRGMVYFAQYNFLLFRFHIV